MEYHRISWDDIEYHGTSMEYHGISKNIIEFHGIYRGISMEYQWNIMESHGTYNGISWNINGTS